MKQRIIQVRQISKCWQIEQEDKKRENADEKDDDGQISLEL